VDPHTSTASHLKALEDTARAAGVELSVHQVSRAEDIGPTLDRVRSSGAKALNVLASALLFNNRTTVVERVADLGLPAIYQWPEMTAQGGLIGYGPSIVQLYKDVQSRQLVRLLKGDKPADLPVEQPTKFELVINMKTARALGLTVRPALLIRADDILE
jgi:putative ABC transport system substrate-binding protein